MKHLLTLAFLLCLGTFASAQIPSYVPTNGLVGWWPFNGNANDESGNGNHGTVNGATLAADRFGNSGKAYSFDGDYTDNITTTLSLGIQGTKSYSLWFKLPLNFINPYCHFVTISGTSNQYLSINGNSPDYTSINIDGLYYDGMSGLMSVNKLNDNIWHHLFVTHDFSLQRCNEKSCVTKR